MLVDEHAGGDAGCVQPVQEVLKKKKEKGRVKTEDTLRLKYKDLNAKKQAIFVKETSRRPQPKQCPFFVRLSTRYLQRR